MLGHSLQSPRCRNSSLKVDSIYGSGSTFYFEILQEVSDSTPIGNLEEATKENKRDAILYQSKFIAPEAKVLVVDDTAVNLKVFSGLLRQTEIVVDKAKSGQMALKMVQKKTYDMIFIDHMMPEMDGIETLRKMKELNINSVFIALTANASTGSRQEYINHGFDDYLAKPIDMELLEGALENYIPKNKIEPMTE